MIYDQWYDIPYMNYDMTFDQWSMIHTSMMNDNRS